MAHAHVDIAHERTTLDSLGKRAIGSGLVLAIFGIIATLMLGSLTGGGPDGAGHDAAGHGAVDHGAVGHGEAGHGEAGHGEAGHGAVEQGAAGHGAHEIHGYISEWSPYHPYLVSFSFFLCITLGSLFFVIIHHLTRAGWSTSLRRLAEGTSRNMFLMALLAIPIVMPEGAGKLYRWIHPDMVDGHMDPLIAAKSTWWLDYDLFVGRVAIYFAIWIGLSFLFHRLSTRQDRTGDPGLSRKMGKITPVAILLFAVTATGAAFDFLMSLDAHWFSTIFGVYFFAGCVLSFHAFLALLAIWLRRNGRLEKAVTQEHLHDVGKMIFAFTVFWAYIAFSQYMLYWYSNIPEETGWYLRRQQTFGWGAWGFFLLFGHFVVPFLFLLSRHVKRRSATLALGAAWMLVVHWCDLYYLVMPNLHHGLEFPFTMLDVTVFLAMGGVYLASTAWNLGRSPLLAMRDPKLPEALAFHNV